MARDVSQSQREAEIAAALRAKYGDWAIKTVAQIDEAERLSRRQLLENGRRYLKRDETKMQPEDKELCDRVLATLTGDGTAFATALAYPPVNALFARGVLYLEKP